jgi:hypothetical protein
VPSRQQLIEFLSGLVSQKVIEEEGKTASYWREKLYTREIRIVYKVIK